MSDRLDDLVFGGHWKHGYIPLDAEAMAEKAHRGHSKSRRSKSTGRKRPRGITKGEAIRRASDRRQREAARRIVASQGLGRGHLGTLRRGGGAPSNHELPRGYASRLTVGAFTGGGFAGFANLMRAVDVELAYRGLDLAWDEKLHPRGWHGKWIKKGALKDIIDDAETEKRYRAHVADIDKRLTALAPTHATENMAEHASRDANGNIVWSDAKTAMHRRLVDLEFRKQVRQGAKKERKAIFLGGLPGAGKTRGMENKLGDVQSQYITVNPDIFKERMAHMGLVQHVEGMSPLEASALHHEESARMAEMLADRARRSGYNIIHDITMNSHKSVAKRLDPLKKDGYTSHAFFFDIPMAASIESVRQRHRNGWLKRERDTTGTHVGQRFVPSAHVASGKSDSGFNSKNREAFESAKHLFDSYDLYDNENYKGQLLESKKAGRIVRHAA